MTKLDWSKAKNRGLGEQASPGRKPRRKVAFARNWEELETLAGADASEPIRPPMTEAELDAGKTAKGGWTRATLAAWGVPWPPPHGWKEALLQGKPIPLAKRATPKSASGDGGPEPDLAALLHQVVMAVTSAGQGHLLADLPDVLALYGSEMPTVADVIEGRPEAAIITGGITFEDKVWSFSCARMRRVI